MDPPPVTPATNPQLSGPQDPYSYQVALGVREGPGLGDLLHLYSGPPFLSLLHTQGLTEWLQGQRVGTSGRGLVHRRWHPTGPAGGGSLGGLRPHSQSEARTCPAQKLCPSSTWYLFLFQEGLILPFRSCCEVPAFLSRAQH